MISTTWPFAPRGAQPLRSWLTNRSQRVINKRKNRAEGMGDVCLARRPTPTPGLVGYAIVELRHYLSLRK
jgi:hypothetical protein